MFVYSILIFIFAIFSTWSAPSKSHRFEQKLTNLSQQLDRMETQLNKSIDQLLEKIEDNTLDIINSLSYARVSRRNGKKSLFPIQQQTNRYDFHRITANFCTISQCSSNH